MKYEQMQLLFTFLKVPNHWSKHWNDYVGWKIVQNLHHVMLITIKEVILASHFLETFYKLSNYN